MSNNFSDEKNWIVGITDTLVPPADIEQTAFPEAEFAFLPDWRENRENRVDWKQVDAILVWQWRVDRATVELLDRCKIVACYSVGFDHVDIEALAERGIPVCNNPAYGTEEVADTASAMILSLQRKILTYDRTCRKNLKAWQGISLLKPFRRTSEQALGIIGVGRIGTAVVNRMKPFGYHILGYDPYQPSGHEKAVGYSRVDSLEELLREGDVVSIHCPLTTETRGMVDKEFFRQMRYGASLVNTARGAILADLDCLEEALRSGHLASAALDVLPEEPPTDHPLIRAWRQDAPWVSGRLLVNPHSAFHSEAASHEQHFKAAETVRMYLLEGRLRNRIEPGSCYAGQTPHSGRCDSEF